MATLDHPLPSGMRDLLPQETAARRAVSRAFLGHAELLGYEPVIPPVFEYAETIERGLGTLDPREIVRFVEPETGEVVALRPDVTPQIARIVATRLDQRPPPHRLAYDASVLRRRAGSRARTHRQIAQVGVELVGVPAPQGDLELLVLAVSALRGMGLSTFTIDLGHAEIARAIVSAAPESADAIADALAKKDAAALSSLGASLPPATRDALLLLPTLHGDMRVLDALPKVVLEVAASAVDALRDLVTRLRAALAAASIEPPTITIDLGEVRGLAYYSGAFFQILADGPGVAIGGGGRYDTLLSRFGRALPATGLALDVDATIWALRVAGSPLLERGKRVIVAEEVPGAGSTLARALRSGGIPTAIVPREGAEAYALAWGYSHIAEVGRDGGARVSLRRVETTVDEAAPLTVDEAVARLSHPPDTQG